MPIPLRNWHFLPFILLGLCTVKSKVTCFNSRFRLFGNSTTTVIAHICMDWTISKPFCLEGFIFYRFNFVADNTFYSHHTPQVHSILLCYIVYHASKLTGKSIVIKLLKKTDNSTMRLSVFYIRLC